jgi:hypothetical protein
MDLSKITLKCPARTPLVVAEALKDILKDKRVCDIGCREGDILLAFLDYAKSGIGVESNENNAKIAQGKGLNVIYADIRNIPMPEADIYYVWIQKPINQVIFDLIPKGLVVIGGDPQADEFYDIPGSRKILVPYNEGDGERQKGVFELTLVQK